LKEQASQIQKVTDRLEHLKPTKRDLLISKIISGAACLAELTSNPKSFYNCPDLRSGLAPEDKICTKPALVKKGRPLAVAVRRVGPERKTLGSGLNAGNIGAERRNQAGPACPNSRSVHHVSLRLRLNHSAATAAAYNGSAALVAGIGIAAASVILAKP